MKFPRRARGLEQKERRRQAIIDAAEKVIARVGLNHAHFGEVAKQSKLSRPLIYVYFPKQEDLFHAVCERALRALEVNFKEVQNRGKNGLERMLELAKAYCHFASTQPLYFSVVSELQTYGIDPAKANEIETNVFHLSRDLMGMVASAIVEGKKDKSIRANVGDPVLSAMSVWSFTHGLVQISSTKQKMMKAEFNVTSDAVVEHGFELLRASFETPKKK